jgi:hypothetical protein
MSDHARIRNGSTDAAFGWSFYARFYAWRFS